MMDLEKLEPRNDAESSSSLGSDDGGTTAFSKVMATDNVKRCCW
eukprot:COSAG05_NODE_1331_length_5154_cov_14.769733_5_plen_44_part_00